MRDNSQTNEAMREEKLDFYKGFLIWSVVLGHCLNVICPGTILHMLIRTFDLPMFMYISGYLLRGSISRYDWKQLVLNKITNIAVPAVIWIIISLLFGDLHSYYFLWAVFVSSVAICLAENICKNDGLGGAVLVLLAIVLHFIPQNVVNISFLFPFCLWGYFSKNIASIGWRQGMTALLIFICLFVFVWKPEYSIWRSGGYILQDSSHMIKVVLIRLVIGGTGIYSAVFLWEKLYKYYKNGAFVKLISNIGKETLAVYLMQHIVVEILLLKTVRTLGIRGMLDGQQLLAGYILTPIISFVLLVIMYYTVNCIKRYKHTKWIFGFKLKTEAYRFL